MMKFTGMRGGLRVVPGMIVWMVLCLHIHAASLQNLRIGPAENRTRLVMQIDQIPLYQIDFDDSSLFVTFDSLDITEGELDALDQDESEMVTAYACVHRDGKTYLKLDLAQAFYVRYFELAEPDRLVIDIYPQNPVLSADSSATEEVTAEVVTQPESETQAQPPPPAEAVTPPQKFTLNWTYVALAGGILLLFLVGFLVLRRARKRREYPVPESMKKEADQASKQEIADLELGKVTSELGEPDSGKSGAEPLYTAIADGVPVDSIGRIVGDLSDKKLEPLRARKPEVAAPEKPEELKQTADQPPEETAKAEEPELKRLDASDFGLDLQPLQPETSAEETVIPEEKPVSEEAATTPQEAEFEEPPEAEDTEVAEEKPPEEIREEKAEIPDINIELPPEQIEPTLPPPEAREVIDASDTEERRSKLAEEIEQTDELIAKLTQSPKADLELPPETIDAPSVDETAKEQPPPVADLTEAPPGKTDVEETTEPAGAPELPQAPFSDSDRQAEPEVEQVEPMQVEPVSPPPPAEGEIVPPAEIDKPLIDEQKAEDIQAPTPPPETEPQAQEETEETDAFGFKLSDAPELELPPAAPAEQPPEEVTEESNRSFPEKITEEPPVKTESVEAVEPPLVLDEQVVDTGEPDAIQAEPPEEIATSESDVTEAPPEAKQPELSEEPVAEEKLETADHEPEETPSAEDVFDASLTYIPVNRIEPTEEPESPPSAATEEAVPTAISETTEVVPPTETTAPELLEPDGAAAVQPEERQDTQEELDGEVADLTSTADEDAEVEEQEQPAEQPLERTEEKEKSSAELAEKPGIELAPPAPIETVEPEAELKSEEPISPFDLKTPQTPEHEVEASDAAEEGERPEEPLETEAGLETAVEVPSETPLTELSPSAPVDGIEMEEEVKADADPVSSDLSTPPLAEPIAEDTEQLQKAEEKPEQPHPVPAEAIIDVSLDKRATTEIRQVVDEGEAVLRLDEGLVQWPVHILEGNRTARILVVDDEPEIVRTLKEFLSRENYDVLGMTDSISALESFGDWHPDLVIADVVMPEMSGVDLIQKIREGNGLSKVIFMSGRTERDAVTQAFEQELQDGRYEFFRKPLSLVQIGSRVRDYFSSAREILTLYFDDPDQFMASIQNLAPLQLVSMQRFLWDRIFEISSNLLGRKIESYFITDRMEPPAEYMRRVGCQEREDYCIADVCFRSNPQCAAEKLQGEIEVMRQILDDFRKEYLLSGTREPLVENEAGAESAIQDQDSTGSAPPPRRTLHRPYDKRNR